MDKKNILLTTVVISVIVLTLIASVSFALTLVDAWSFSSQSEWDSVFSSASRNATIKNASLQIEDQRWQLEHTRNTKNVSLSDIQGIFWRKDGTKLYISDGGFDGIIEYNVSDPWNISSATLTGNNLSTGRYTEGVFWKNDGTKMYEVKGDNWVYEYVVPDPWNLSSAVYSSPARDGVRMNTDNEDPRDIFWKPDGTKLYDIGRNSNSRGYINEYKVSDPWNLSSAVYDGFIYTEGSNPKGLFWKPGGQILYTIDQTDGLIRKYKVSEPWNVTTATYTGNRKGIEHTTDNPNGVYWKPDGTKLYEVNRYNIFESDVSFPDSGIFVTEWKSYDNRKVAEDITQSINTGSGSIEVKIEAYDSSTASTSETNWLSLGSDGTVTKELGNIEGDEFRIKYRLKK